MSKDTSLLINKLNQKYELLHRQKEELFWSTKMGLSNDFNAYNLAEEELMKFIQNHDHLKSCEDALCTANGKDHQTLKGWIAFFKANIIEKPSSVKLKKKLIHMESALAQARKDMSLGYIEPSSKEFIPTSSVGLSLKLSTHDNSQIRKACYEGLRSIETFILSRGFLDIIKIRNQFARSLGYRDFYAYKLKQTEGIDMHTLFSWLEDLEAKTRNSAKHVIENLRSKLGEEAITPWNFRYFTQNNSTKNLDPYMPFSESVLRWGKSFSSMGVRFKEAKLQLDLIDRKGKYENGFCHAPIPPYISSNNTFIRAKINFTSNAVPNQLGSGYQALQTLFHEGGHAAHFANISMGAPCFSQEFAPSSVAMAETQSMFFDSLLSDSDWLNRYAKVPWEIISQKIMETHPLKVIALRQMLIVPFVERALYSLKDNDLTEKTVLNLCKDIEEEMSFIKGGSPRPTLAIPHLLEMESSAYYHGYILAQCAVEQTRFFFFQRDGHIVDNPQIGPELSQKYWKQGNSIPFVDFIKTLTGKPFSTDSLIESVSKTNDFALEEQKDRLRFIEKIPEDPSSINLNLHMTLVNGKTIIGSTEKQSFEQTAQEFKTWLQTQKTSLQ